MNRTVQELIENLEETRTLLRNRVMDERYRAKRNQLEAELRAVESALTLYRSALEIEDRLSSELT